MEATPELDRGGLRRFALTVGAAFAILFGLLFPWLLGTGPVVWPWVLAGVLVLWGLVAPASLGPVHRGWMRLALALNRITSPIVLGVLYYLVLTPIGLVMRLAGRDPMARRRDPAAESYRVPSAREPREKMEKPY